MASPFVIMSLHDPQHHDPLPAHNERPSSIDLTLELEHQLENESVPPTPAPSGRPQSLDPHVLASIIMQLRHSLSEVSRERDQLLHRLSEAQSQESHFKESLRHMSAECTRTKDELEASKQKIRDDEHAITMLRTKVEESRRGVMRLQTENRRMSQVSLGIDISRAGIPIIGGPPSNKRASFTPLTGTGAARPVGHRRMSSVSDSLIGSDFALKDVMNPNPNAQVLTIPHASKPSSSLHRSGFLRSSPPNSDLPQGPRSAEIATLRLELKSIKEELDEARNELCDANEAREASEMCVKALRGFIEESNMGGPAAPVKVLPPSTTTTTGEEAESKKNGMGWSFKLWKVDTSAKQASTGSASNAAVSPIRALAPQTTAMAPLSKKLGGFFSSMASPSSHPPAPPNSYREEGMYHGSDSSSIEESLTEPISPAGVEGTGTSVIVRDCVSSSPELVGNPDQMKNLDDQVFEVELS